MSVPLLVGGQRCWVHDENDDIGFFHTFDEFLINEYFPARKIHIFLPKDYCKSNEKYPVIYTNDGQDIFFSHHGSKSLQMTKVLKGVFSDITNQKLKYQFHIIVAIHANENRDHEYNHEEIVEGIGGGLQVYSSYLCEIKNWVDENYRTFITPEYNSILGTSHGGLAAFYIATRNPNYFNSCICMSPSFWAGMDSNVNNPMLAFELIQEGSIIKEILDDLLSKKLRPRIYIDWGGCRDDILENKITEALVEKRGFEFVHFFKNILEYKEYSDNNCEYSELMVVIDHMGGHNELAWNWRLHGALFWLFTGKNTQPKKEG